LTLLRARGRRTRRPVRQAVEHLAGWYMSRSIQSYKYLQTGELPPSIVRDHLKIAVAKLRVQHRRILDEMQRSI